MLIQPLTPEILEKRRRFRRKILSLPGRFWRKTRRGILWTLAVAFVAHSALNIYASMQLNRELAAIRQKGEPLQFSELAPPAVPDAQNAALVYAQATKSLTLSKAERNAFNTPLRRRTPQMNRDVGTLLDKNQNAVALTRRAASMPQCRFPLEYETDNPIVLLFPYYGEARELAQLLATQANREAENHDTVAALRDVRAIFGISHHLSNEPTLIGFLVAQAVDATAHQTLAQILESVPLTPSQAIEFQNSLPVNDWNRALRNGLIGERTFGLSVFDRLARATFKSEEFSLFGNGSPPSILTSYPFLLLWRPALKLDQVQSLRLWRKVLSASSDQQFGRSSTSVDSISQALRDAPRYAVVTRVLFPVFARVGEHQSSAEVRRRQRELALALAVYRTAKGYYPAQLSEVALLWGKVLPLDPYSNKPFGYHRDQKGFQLYSVGVNRVDNGGKSQGFGANLNINNDDILWGGTRY